MGNYCSAVSIQHDTLLLWRQNSLQTLVKKMNEKSLMLLFVQTSGIVLPLPPKKMFGNMDNAFIVERQEGLQVFTGKMHSCIAIYVENPPTYA